ncbi:MAG TPA: carboxypeptidase-like regulatory domain-containing protein [Acidimicrobiia bacterium]
MRIRVTPERLDVTPGVPASFEVAVYNTSGIIEGFTVALGGLDRPIALISSPPELSLFPDSEGTAIVTFTLPRDFPAGEHTVLVQVTGTAGPGAPEAAPLAVQVAPVYDAGLTLEPQSVTGGGKARFTVVAENRGNVPLAMTLSATDAEGALQTRFAATELEVPPGRRVRAAMQARGKRPLLGAPAPRILTVRATGAPAPPAEALATFIQKPRIPRALLTLMAILLALGLWGAVLFRGVNRAANQVAAEVKPKGSSLIVGRVTDGNAPLGGASVEAKGKEGEATTTTLTRGDVGAFTLADLGGPDTYLVTVKMDGFATQTALVPVPADSGSVVQVGILALGKGSGSITGTVAADKGGPLGGVQVTVTKGAATLARAVTAGAGSIGFYSVGGLVPPGPYTVTFDLFGYVSKSVEVGVATDTPTALDAALVPAASSSITGLVTYTPVRVPACAPGQCPLAGVTVTVAVGDAKHSATTASTPAADLGKYTVADLPAGDYTVSFAKEGFVTQTLRVTLAVGQPITVNAALSGLPGTVSGTAVGCTGVDARKRDLSELDPRRQAVPSEDGSYILGDLPTPGEYRLVFKGPQLRTVDVTLGPGDKQAVNASCAAATTTTATTTSTTTTTTAPPPTTTSSTTTTTTNQETPPSSQPGVAGIGSRH